MRWLPEIVGASTYWPLKACPGLYSDFFNFTCKSEVRIRVLLKQSYSINEMNLGI